MWVAATGQGRLLRWPTGDADAAARAYAAAVLPHRTEDGLPPDLVRRRGRRPDTLVLSAPATEPLGTRNAAPGVVLVVEQGPDAGIARILPRGVTSVGRGAARVRLTAADVSRHHADFTVDSRGVGLMPREGTVHVEGPRTSDGLVDERHRLRLGRDVIRILPRPPMPVPPGRGDPLALPADEVSLPRAPWLALVGSLAPAAVGLVLWWVTDQWYMLLFGALGIVTGGPLAVADLLARRRARRRLRAGALRRVRAARAAHPPPGILVASWSLGHAPSAGPTTSGRDGDRQGPLSCRVGTLPRASLGADPPDAASGRSRVRVRRVPALCHPLPGERIVVAGPLADATVRCVVAGWLRILLDEDDAELEVGADAALPATVLALPGVRLLDPGAGPLVARMRRRPPGVPSREGTAAPGNAWVELRRGTGGLPGAAEPRGSCVRIGAPLPSSDWFVDTDALRLRHGSRSHALHPDTLSFAGLGEAIAALLQRPHDGAGGDVPAAPPLSSAPAAPHGASGGSSWGLVVGEGPQGEVCLDLVEDGPHALIAGTTGSGKSAFLRSWLVALARAHAPSELRLVLLDFKGGSTFAPLAGLPHTEGVVTDLAAEHTERVLAALGSAVRERERWLTRREFSDLREAERAGDPERPPRVVVAVDEFRVLAEEVPEVLDHLVRLATVGRSLGIHLVLSTQRPQGVVSPDIRANVSLLVCLRVASDVESFDVLGTAAAATLDAARPGTALIRRAGGACEAVRFHAEGLPVPARAPILFGPSCADQVTLPRIPAAPDAFEETVRALRRTTGRPRALIPAALPPAPTRLAVRDPSAHPEGANAVMLGLRERPDGRPAPWTWSPGSGGGLAWLAGNDATLRDATAGWLGACAASPAWAGRAIVLDGIGALAAAGLSRSTFLGTAVPEEAAWADELLEHLAAEAARPGPPLLLGILGLGAWWGGGALPEDMAREAKLRAALRCVDRVVPVLAGGRELPGSRWLAACPLRVFLPLAAGEEVTGLWPRLRGVSAQAGRGVLTEPGGPARGTPVQSLVAPGEGARDRRRPPPVTDPWLPPARQARASRGGDGPGAVGLRSVTRAPVTWAPSGSAVLIVGAGGSGRSATLALLSGALRGTVVPGLPGSDEPPDRSWWAVDDADLWPPASAFALADRVRRGGRVIATATAGPRLHHAVPWWTSLDPARDVVVLGPRHASEAEALGLRLPAEAAAPPGRAWLTPAGGSAPVRVQLYAPGDAGAPP